MWTICRRELTGALASGQAVGVLTGWLLLFALFSLGFDDMFDAGRASMRAPFAWAGLSLVLLVPALTMRTLAEERRSGHIELLATWPVTATQIVVGKWLSVVLTGALALTLTLSWPLALGQLGALDVGATLGGYIGLLGLVSALAAVGVCASAWSQHQLVAFLIALAIGGVGWATDWFLPSLPPALTSLVESLTLQHNTARLGRGVLEVRALTYFAGITVVALRTAVLALEQRRLS